MTVSRDQEQWQVLGVDEPDRLSERRPPLLVRLALVVRLSDPLTEAGRPQGAVWIRLDPGGRAPVYNLSGEACFLDLPAGAYTLQLSGTYYRRLVQPVTVPLLDPQQPVQTVVLQPLPWYPFPAGSTVLRGLVREVPDVPVAEAQVRLRTTGSEAWTTERGEFVLCWPPLAAEQVLTERTNGTVRRLLRDETGGTQHQIDITHPTYQRRSLTVPAIVEGTMTNLGVITVSR
ncbi:MAG: hypothetical protein AB7N91_21300 [Candidatus Tectimicrobiota bacterium]